MFHFLTLWKSQKTFDLLTYSGSIEIKHWNKMGQFKRKRINLLVTKSQVSEIENDLLSLPALN